MLRATLLLTTILALARPAGAVIYVGSGSLSGTDLSGLSDVLQDGTRDDLLGAFGSGIAYTGQGNRYIAVPDRGPNATNWNPAVDNTTSWVDRFDTFTINVTPGSGTGNGSVSAALKGTTLLSSPTPLAGTPNPNPALNAGGKTGQNYFTGFSSDFVPGTASTNQGAMRFDPEGMRVSNDGRYAYVSDEYGPHIYQFDRATGERVASIPIPAKFAIANQASTGAAELSGNLSGRQSNRGMEGLAISPDGKTLFGIMQSPLIQDGALNDSLSRVGTNVHILAVDVQSGATREYLYTLDRRQNGVSEIVAINDHELLVDERDGNGGTSAAYKKLIRIDLTGATDISGVAALPSTGVPAGVAAVSKSILIDLLDPAFGLAGASFPEKIEGLAFGPDLANGDHLLLVSNDNDFLPGNPNLFLAFAISPQELPTFQAQGFAAVPEPGTLGLVGMGLIGLLHVSRRRLRMQAP